MAYSKTSYKPNNFLPPSGSSRNGCEHYKRGCQLLAPCCNKLYSCRFCHDDNEAHMLIRSMIKTVSCNNCKLQQKLRPLTFQDNRPDTSSWVAADSP